MERLSSASFPSRSMVALISLFLGVILHLNGFGLIFNPSLLHGQSFSGLKIAKCYLRIAEYINRDLFSRRLERFLDIESPKQSSDTDKRPLFSKGLARTDTSSPTKCHVPTLVWKRSMIWTILQKPLWVESIGIWEIFFIPVDRPHVSLHPGILRYQPSLFPKIRQIIYLPPKII